MAIKLKKLGKLTQRPLLLVAALVLIAALVVFGLTRKTKSVPGTIPSTSTSSPATSSSDKTTVPSASSSSNTSNPAKSSNSNSVATLPLSAPWGDFVSNHSPGKDGSPTSEVSTCNTTPGAACYIQFTKDGVTRSLGTKTTDSNGSVSWSWDIKDASLSSGNWQITAVATLNGQSKSTSDQLALEVQ